jgi:transposase
MPIASDPTSRTKVPPKKKVHRERNRIERFFDKLKQFRPIATRYDKLGAIFLALVRSLS